jgi:N-acetylneuraminic acid mutarotase
LLPDGHVLAIGGARNYENDFTAGSFIHEIESYDPQVNRWSVAGELSSPEAYATATLLLDGRVWVTGGLSGSLGTDYSSTTWLLIPSLVQP